MKKIEIYHGQPIGNQKGEGLLIEIVKPFPDGNFEESPSKFNNDSKKIEQALYEHVPGGTYDALLGLMLKRKSTVFVVPHNQRVIKK